ncbi:MAG: class I SAM-dependent methyltransferase, partial [Miltoncostaeaceae bacterium]
MAMGLVRHLPFPDRRAAVRDVRDRVADVEGWLTDGEGALLYELARGNRGGAIVEIGSWKGRSTIWLAEGSRAGRGAVVVAIDPHTGSEEHRADGEVVDTFSEFRTNLAMAGVEEVVRPERAMSVDAAARVDEPVGLLFIDGAHDRDSVLADIDAWFPKLAPHGMIAFHDVTASWPGVARAIGERLVEPGRVDRLRFVHSIVYARKRA